MSDVRAQLVDALRTHYLWPEHQDGSEHLADVLLSLPGIAIVELPEPDDDGNFRYGRNYVYADSDHLVMTRYGTEFGNAEEVREIAAALLAAANAAESEAK